MGDLVERMLAKEPVRRPRDGGSVLEALTAIRDGNDRATPPEAPVRVRRRLPRLAIPGLVAGLLAAAVAGVLVSHPRFHALRPAEPGAAPSIAVMPFADESQNHDQGYFADGIAEEILDALAQVEGLRVAGRTSSFYFKGKDARLADIGRELRVAHVLEGSVRKSGSRVRVTAGVVRVADGSRLWGKSFDRDLTDIFVLQDEIAQAVAAALRVKLVQARTQSGAVGSPEALNEFLRGRDFVRSGGLDDMRSAVAAFERALSLDPNFALAWAGLSQALIRIESMAGEGFSAERRRQALAAADRAIELAPDLPQGYVQRSNHRLNFAYDWKGALADAERALTLGPGDADAVLLHAWILAARGESGLAAVEAERAVELDPLQAGAWVLLGISRMNAGDHERARAVLGRALEIKPRGELARVHLVVGWMAAARPDAALAVAQKAKLPWVRLFGTALAQHDLGHPRESQAALDELVARNANDAAYQIAEVYAWRGEGDRAFAWLERARRQGDPGITYLKYDVLLRAIRRDPRFAELLRKLDLPPD